MRITSVTDDCRFTQHMTNHRAYVSRQWQYFIAHSALGGLLLRSLENSEPSPESANVYSSLSLAPVLLCAVLVSAVFFHLILWTKVRIRRNALMANKLVPGFIDIEPNKRFMADILDFAAITIWLELTVLAFVAYYVGLLYRLAGLLLGSASILMFVSLICLSLHMCKKHHVV